MSMDVYLRFLLFFILTAYSRAGPLPTASLPEQLSNNIPTCAQPCLQSFVAESFPSSVCSNPSIHCLCSSDSTSGFTVGEGALRCLVSACPQWDEAEAETAYEVCSTVQNALPNTHTIITATHMAVNTVNDAPSTASNTPTSSSSHHSSFSTSKSQHSSSSSASKSASAVYSTPTTVTSSSSSRVTTSPSNTILAIPATSSAAAPPTPILTRPQLAGVVVASIGAAALAFGLCFLLFCCRRKRSQRRHSGSSFGGDKVVGSADSSPDMATIAARQFGHDPEGKEVVTSPRPPLSLVTPGTTGEGGWSQWRRNTAPQDIGLALAPGDTPRSTGPSPITPASYRTTSQLLPEKPSYSLFPSPLRPSPHSRRASQSLEALAAARNGQQETSPTTRSNPRFPGSLDTSQAYMQSEPNLRSSVSSPQIFPYMQNSQARPQSSYLAYRQGENPDYVIGPHRSEPEEAIRKPLPAHHSPSARGLRPDFESQPPTILRDYPPPPPPIDPRYLKALVGSSQHRDGTPRRKKSDPRPVTYLSTGSETSFEDADVDDDDLPEPVSALSPVAEQHSPITYPRIPTTFAESPTKRPHIPEKNPDRYPQRSDSLLAKRRGPEKAAEITDGLHPRSEREQLRGSAKWKILVSPGLEGINSSPGSNSTSSRMARGAGLTPAFADKPTGRIWKH